MPLYWKDVRPRFLCVDGYRLDQVESGYSVYTGVDIKTPSEKRERREANRKGKLIVKGMKKLFKESKQKGAFEQIGEGIHGNRNNPVTKFNKLVNCCDNEMLQQIGEGKQYNIESYVDGSYTVSII